jgi:hypothetical protein
MNKRARRRQSPETGSVNNLPVRTTQPPSPASAGPALRWTPRRSATGERNSAAPRPRVGLAGVAFYGLVMVATGTIVRDGGPGWVNLFFIIGFWNTCRFTFLIPTSVVRLLRVRHQEKVLLRDWQRTRPADPAPAEAGRMDTRVPAAQAS